MGPPPPPPPQASAGAEHAEQWLRDPARRIRRVACTFAEARLEEKFQASRVEGSERERERERKREFAFSSISKTPAELMK